VQVIICYSGGKWLLGCAFVRTKPTHYHLVLTMPIPKFFIASDLIRWRFYKANLTRWILLISMTCIGGIFRVLCWEKCWCHFWTMLDMQLHSYSNLAFIRGYNSDNGSFRDCIVSHCVQMCLSHVVVMLNEAKMQRPRPNLWGCDRGQVFEATCR